MESLKHILVATYILTCSVFANAEQITLIIASSAGGMSHQYAMQIAPVLKQEFNLPVEIRLKPGAEGTIAATELQNCKVQDYCILLATVKPIKDRVSLQKVDLITDIRPLTYAGTVPSIAVVRYDSKYRTLKSILETTDRVSYGVSQQNQVRGLAREIFISKHKGQTVEVPYKSGGDVIKGVLSGELTVGLTTADVLIGLANSGMVRPLVVIGTQKSHVFPEVPLLTIPKLTNDITVSQPSFFLWTSNTEDRVFIEKAKNTFDTYLTGSESNNIKNTMDIHLIIKQYQYKELLSKILNHK